LKTPTTKKTKVPNNPEETKEWINQTLKRIHRKMIELFGVDFPYFNDIKIIRQSEILKELTEHMRNDLEEHGVVYSNIQWKQIRGSLSKNHVTGFFENFAFYNPRDEVLYIHQKMVKNHPQKIIPVCTHELAEKLLSTYLPSPLKTPIRTVVEAHTEAQKTNNTKRPHKLLNTYTDIIFKSIFKEGFCEAIALQTLRHIDSEMMKAEAQEKELQIGHSKCLGLLLGLDKAYARAQYVESMEKSQVDENGQRTQPLNRKKLVKEILNFSQIIKVLSYYIGYPLAKAVMERYGIKGAKIALGEDLPLRAQYFVNPRAYLTHLEKPKTFIE
jgi:hypothetical protein